MSYPKNVHRSPRQKGVCPHCGKLTLLRRNLKTTSDNRYGQHVIGKHFTPGGAVCIGEDEPAVPTVEEPTGQLVLK